MRVPSTLTDGARPPKKSEAEPRRRAPENAPLILPGSSENDREQTLQLLSAMVGVADENVLN